MATLKINGKDVTVEDNTLILDAARSAGFDIPTFCYQANLSRLGSCRICLVEIKGQRKLQPSCVTPVMQDMEVFTDTEIVTDSRRGVLEFFLSNHALDCPVCDKGGECELQDMVHKHGPHEGVHAEKKIRFHERDYTLSPVIVKNSNRCVQCQRCVRVCREAVGVGALGAQGRGAHQEETSFLRTPLECDHCGNCIEVCPVGCFMRRPYRYKARPWDLKSAASVCPYCATGCRITIQERDGVVIRSVSKEGNGINDKLLCARGRFGFDFVNNKDRLKAPLKKNAQGEFEEISWDEAIELIKKKFHFHTASRIGALTSARLTNEEYYLFSLLMRDIFKTENIDSSSRWDSEVALAFCVATGITNGGSSISDALKADTVLITGSQVSDENPVTDYLMRLSFDTSRKTVMIASPRGMKLDRNAKLTLRNLPSKDGTLLMAIALSIFVASENELLSSLKWAGELKGASLDKLADEAGLDPNDVRLAAKELTNAKDISLFVGTEFLRFPASIKGLVVLVDILRGLGKKVSIVPLLDRCNQRGAWDMGMLAGVRPGYKQAEGSALSITAMLSAAVAGDLDRLYIVGEDVVDMFPDEPFVRSALSAVDFLVVQDTFMTPTASMADLVLPSATFAEKAGSITNQEGRVQAIEPLLKPPGKAKSDFQIFRDIISNIDSEFTHADAGDVFCEISEVTDIYSDVEFSFGSSASTLSGKSHGAPGLEDVMKASEVTRSSQTSGEGELTLVTGNHLLFSGTLSSHSEILNTLQSDPVVEISPSQAIELGLKSGERVIVKGKHISFLFILRTNKGTRPGVAFIAENYIDAPVNRFFTREERLPLVTIKKA